MARERGRQWFLDQLRSGKPLMGETAEDLVATMFALAEKLQPVKSVPPAWKAITGVPEEFPPSTHQHSWLTDLLDIPEEFPPEAHQHAPADIQGEWGWIDFNTAIESIPLKVGRLGWDSEAETLAVYLPNGVRLQIGQEQYTPRSKNTSGSTILNGRAVYIKGASGNSPEVGLANASDPVKSKVIAIATTDVSNNNHGVFTTSGYVRDIDTSAWAEGAELFLSTTDGVLTTTAPSKPNVRVSIGYVVRSHATLGSILVSIHRQPTLEELGAADNEVVEDGKLWTGFADPKFIVQAYDPIQRVVSMSHYSGAIEMWYRGRKTVRPSPWTTPAHPNTVGNWFYYSADGVNFAWSQTPWEFEDVIVAYVRFGTYLKFGIRECHGLMDPNAHRNDHINIGTYVASGGTLTAGTYAVKPASPVDADNSPAINQTVLHDEDLGTTVVALPESTYRVLFPVGAEFNSVVRQFPFTHTASGYINWFNNGVETQGQTLKFYNVYALAIPAMGDAGSQSLRWVFIAPQAQYNNETDAAAEEFANINYGDFAQGITEYVPRFKITFATSASYSTTGKVRIHNAVVLDRSRVQATQTVTPTATSLNDLTDVDTVGAVEGSILIAGGDGIWRPSGPEFVDAINQLLLDRRAWGAEWGYIWEIP